MPLGINCKLFRNTGTYATPAWNEVASLSDLEYSLVEKSFDTTTRAGLGIETSETTTSGFDVNFMLQVPEPTAAAGDPVYDDHLAFKGAKNANAALEIMVLTGGATTNGVEGFRCFMKIHEFSESQKNGDALFKKVALKPCQVPAATLAATSTAEICRRVLVTGGAPTYASWGSNTFA